MTAQFLGVRELVVRDKPGRIALPVSGEPTTTRAAATLTVAVCDGGRYHCFHEAGELR